jgi:protein involved in ribonucleotide reduction
VYKIENNQRIFIGLKRIIINGDDNFKGDFSTVCCIISEKCDLPLDDKKYYLVGLGTEIFLHNI